MEPRARLFLHETGADGLFGDGKWDLLEAVREYGSLQTAAKTLGRGYRKAWEDIRKVEVSFGRKVVVRSRGGPSGGSTELTEFGARLLEAWKQYRADVSVGMNRAYDKYLKELIDRG